MIKNNQKDKKLQQSLLQGWLFPDNNIDPTNSITSGQFHTLSVMWYEILSGGTLDKRDASGDGSNFYFTTARAETMRKYSVEQYVCVTSGSITGCETLMSSSSNRLTAITELVNFCKDNYFTGVDLDLEIFSVGGGSDSTKYGNFKTFCRELGAALHAEGKKLRIDCPAIWNSATSVTSNEWTNRNSSSYYTFKYEDFENFPEVDQLVIMAYDYYTDNGFAYDSNASISPLEWAKDCFKFVRTKISDPNRLVAGIPNYGVYGGQGTYSGTEQTYPQMKSRTGYSSATRHSASGEMKFTDTAPTPDVDNYYCDEETLNQKRLAAVSCGIYRHCIWKIDGVSKFGNDGTEPNSPENNTPKKVKHFYKLTDAATIATDCSKSNRFTVTLGGNRTLGNPTYAADGEIYVWELKQDGTGSHTLSLDTKFAFGTDITSITLTTTANKRDFLITIYRAADDKFYVLDFRKGY